MQILQSLFTKYWIFVVSKKNKNIYIHIQKLQYHNRFLPFALRYTFTFLCLVISWNLWNLFEI